MNELINVASSTGMYSEVAVDLTSEESIVYLVEGLSIKKSADKRMWMGGHLTYTIAITNNTPMPYESPIITDSIDTRLATLVDGTVTINDVPATPSQYSFESGTIKVFLDSIGPNSETVVKFKVEQV